VQRVPVRIALDPKELTEHPLQIGLSMQVDVDTHQRGGGRLPQIARAGAPDAARLYGAVDEAAAKRVRDIIAANDRGATKSDATVASARTARPASTAAARPAHLVASGRPPLVQ
jgi:membrane fusion protein (multidrug efflux system)